ncbi:hypothetical protein BSKO_12126 [Bryopsis sp. KO-2023]|nr:hypothetical protein BSKO_12126 [Bryopsis sp. KO-2023]
MAKEIRLYFAPKSFSSQIARLALVEKRVAFEARVVDIYKEENFASWYARLNPKLYVPTLLHGERIVTDCHQIARYVDRTFAGPKLVPESPSDLKVMESLIDLQTGIREKELTLSCAGSSGADFVRKKVQRLRDLVGEEGESVDVFKCKLKEWLALQNAVAQPDLAEAIGSEVDSALAGLAEQLTQVEDSGFYVLGSCYCLADIVWTVLLARLNRLGLSSKFDASTHPLVSRYYAQLQKRASFHQAEIS